MNDSFYQQTTKITQLMPNKIILQLFNSSSVNSSDSKSAVIFVEKVGHVIYSKNI
jgi:hypothetical protein